ncbi:uncharacterized protein LOC130558558 isoform X2 [Triplophysa rosa]|uniref:uncharacterized protein LOC130558558 isoform X2 n=1 Tax=Triplophysa rosa TaxID=992332 RepID=UPI00254630AF|nr:uncharacterized protein LOC130558558 isoform X2 [Triplophysa rosa]
MFTSHFISDSAQVAPPHCTDCTLGFQPTSCIDSVLEQDTTVKAICYQRRFHLQIVCRTIRMDCRKNDRGHEEQFYKGRHLKLNELREMDCSNEYLYKPHIPNYPKNVQFQVSHLRHDTNVSGLFGIMESCGFKKQGFSGRPNLVWWSLDISKRDITETENQYLQENRFDPGKSFLHHFTSSPAFLSSSRLGNFRFSMSIDELLQFYKNQFCEGQEPDIRVFETVVYKQEVMYVIVIHGPDARDLFSEYPLLQDTPDAVCVLRGNTIIWRAQAMSKTHRFRLSRYMKAHRLFKKQHQYYVWDHIGVAFHVPHGEVFSFSKEKLLESLWLCNGAEPKTNKEEFVKCDFFRIRPE